MKYELKQIAQQTGMRLDAQEFRLVGYYRDFLFLIQHDRRNKQYLLQVWAKSAEPQERAQLEQYLLDYQNGNPQFMARQYDGNRIVLQIQQIKPADQAAMVLLQTMDQLALYLQGHQFHSCCQDCGREDGVDLYLLESGYYFACEDCYHNLSDQIKTNRQQPASGNVVAGIVGAILFSLVGVALWVFINRMGYIAAISGLVITVCAFKGYEVFGKKLTTPGLISCIVVAVLMCVFSTYVSLCVDIYVVLQDYFIDATIMDAIDLVPLMLEDGEILGAYARDLLIGLALGAVASFGYVRNAYQMHKHGFLSNKIFAGKRATYYPDGAER